MLVAWIALGDGSALRARGTCPGTALQQTIELWCVSAGTKFPAESAESLICVATKASNAACGGIPRSIGV